MIGGKEGTVVQRLEFEEVLLNLANDVGYEPSIVIVRQSIGRIPKGGGIDKKSQEEGNERNYQPAFHG